MSIFFLDYKEQLKNIIAENYEPADIVSKEFEYSTYRITLLLSSIFPSAAIDEHMVYEALLELGYSPKEDPRKPLKYSWYFKRKNSE